MKAGALVGFIASSVAMACSGGDSGKGKEEPGWSPALPGEGKPAWFEEVAGRAGIDFRHVPARERRFRFPEIMGAGLGFADVDGDGFLDLYCVQGGELDGAGAGASAPTDRLYRNRRDGTFEDVTAASGIVERGYGMGCAFGDADGDGHVDLYVTNVGPNALYRNRGLGTFEDVTARAGVGDPRWSTSSSFLDYDADGDLDLFVVNYVNWSSEREIECRSPSGRRDYCSPLNYNAPAADILYRNEGGLAFTDVSEASGIARNFGNGLGLACGDFDQDGRMDVYVANDLMPNQLWLGRADGTFRDVAVVAGCAVDADGKSKAGMGCVAFDYQQDGDLDLFMTHLGGETNTLYRNDAGRFTDKTDAAGLGLPSLPFTGFGVGAADFDHDGLLDLYVANGRVTLGPTDGPTTFDEPNQLYRGLDGQRFEEVAPRGGTLPPLVGNSRGAAFGDYDNDGDVDVAVSDNGGGVALLENVAARGHWIELRVLGAGGSDALGASVRVAGTGRIDFRTVQAGFSYCSSNDPRVHVGRGTNADPVTVTVRWLDGTQEAFGPLDVDALHVIRKGTGARSE
jgi:hypothetical protein